MKPTMLATCAIVAFGAIADAQEATIVANPDYVTFVNLLVPKDSVSVEELAAAVALGVQHDVVRFDGFISGSVHQSLDGSYVINYAQWENAEALQVLLAALQNGDAPDLAAAVSMATFEFHPYTVVSVTTASE